MHRNDIFRIARRALLAVAAAGALLPAAQAADVVHPVLRRFAA